MSVTTNDVGEGVLVAPTGHRNDLASALGLTAAYETATGLPEGVQQVAILVEASADAALFDTDDASLAALVDQLKDVVHQTQAAAEHLGDHGAGGLTIALLLPSYAALGKAESSLAGALVDGLMSFCRTIAIELRKDQISLNVVFYDSLQGEDAAAASALLTSYRAAPSITGQETYTGFGPNLGKVKP